MSRYQDEVTVLRAPLVKNSYTGNETRDWATATATPLAAQVQPEKSTEIVDGRQVTTTWLNVHTQPGDIRATDRIRWAGLDYDIDGSDVQAFRHRGVDHHLEFVAKRVTG